MDLTYSEEHEAFRAEVREFLKGWPLTGADAERPKRNWLNRSSSPNA